MNKQLKAIVEYLNQEKEAIRKGFFCPNDVLNFVELTMIIDYINQLETNIDEAIEYIKHSWWLRTDQTYDTSKDLKGWEVEELLSILERGKE
jgi:hypothetical protein